MELLDHMVVLLLVFKRISILFSIVATPIYIPTHSVWGFPFPSHPFQYLLFVEFLIIAILIGVRYLAVALTCTSLRISNVEHIFICLLSIYMSFLTYLGLLLIFDWLVCFLDIELYDLFLCILDINPFFVSLFAIIFSNSVGCLFILYMISFAGKCFYILLGLICLFLLWFFALKDWSKERFLWFYTKDYFTYMLFYRFYGVMSYI